MTNGEMVYFGVGLVVCAGTIAVFLLKKPARDWLAAYVAGAVIMGILLGMAWPIVCGSWLFAAALKATAWRMGVGDVAPARHEFRSLLVRNCRRAMKRRLNRALRYLRFRRLVRQVDRDMWSRHGMTRKQGLRTFVLYRTALLWDRLRKIEDGTA